MAAFANTSLIAAAFAAALQGGPVLGLEDQLGAGPARGRELLGHDVERLLRLRPRDREGVVQLRVGGLHPDNGGDQEMTHTATTRHLWVKHQTPSRYSPPGRERCCAACEVWVMCDGPFDSVGRAEDPA